MDYLKRDEAIKKWLEWEDKTEDGQERFLRETNWMPFKPGGHWDLTFMMRNPA